MSKTSTLATLSLLALVMACSTTSGTPDGGKGTPSPDGQGFCCLSGAGPGLCSADDLPSGGFAKTEAECASHVLSFADGCPTVSDTDSHGCSVTYSPTICARQCGAPVPRPDAGDDAAPDAPADAPGDAHADAPTDAPPG